MKEERNEVGNRRSTFKWMWEKIKSRGRKTHHKVLATRVRTMVCYRFPSPRSDEERARERETMKSLSTQASSLPPPRNSGVESAEHRDENRFSLRHRRVSKQGGRICVGHSRLIAAKLARSPTIRWNFRNFLLDHRSALVALRPNHGLECCWKWAGWFSTIIEFFKGEIFRFFNILQKLVRRRCSAIMAWNGKRKSIVNRSWWEYFN